MKNLNFYSKKNTTKFKYHADSPKTLIGSNSDNVSLIALF